MKTEEKHLNWNRFVATSGEQAAVCDGFVVSCNPLLLLDHMKGAEFVDFYLCGICSQGGMTVGINFREHEVEPQQLFMLTPNDVLCNLRIASGTKCCFVAFAANGLPQFGTTIDTYLYLQKFPVVTLTPEETHNLLDTLLFLEKKLRGGMLHSLAGEKYMQALLYEVYSLIIKRVPSEQKGMSVRSEDICKKFMHHIATKLHTTRRVEDYASMQFITPKYLTSVVKQVTGRSAYYWINRQTMIEIKTLLNSTTLNISEISDRLNFSNASFFTKFFRKQSGLTPSQYRREFCGALRHSLP